LPARHWRLLVCPVNKVGRVSLYRTDRHGSSDGASAPAFLGAISPQVIVVNNGPRKGLGQSDDRVKPLEIPGKPSAFYEKNGYLQRFSIDLNHIERYPWCVTRGRRVVFRMTGNRSSRPARL
jgi:hypothetical protein